MVKKILVVSTSFYPKNSPRAFRTTELIKELCRQKYDVTLMTYYDEQYHKELSEKYGFKIINLGYRKCKNFKFGNSKIGLLLARIVTRLMLLFFEYPDIEIMFDVKRALKRIPKSSFDLLISIAVPHPTHWGVAWALDSNHKLAKTWIADCGDAYMGADLDTFNKMFYFKYFEKHFCNKADFITIPNISMKRNFYPEFSEKFVEITQGFKFEDTKALLEKYEKNTIPTFAFAGTFIQGRGSRDPRPFINYLLEKGYKYKFYIFTLTPDLITPLLPKSNDQIEVKGYIPRNELISFLSKMDFLVNIAYEPSRQLPSKLIDYYLIERPILNIYDDQLNIEIKENIDKFLNNDYSVSFTTNNIEQYKIENVVDKFIELGGK